MKRREFCKTLLGLWTWMMAQANKSIAWFDSEREILAPPPDITVSEWADRERIIPPGARQPGPWDTSLTPYLKEPMDAFNDPDIRHIVLCFGTQLGKTETLYNIIGFILDQEPYPTLVVYPTKDVAKEISRNRIKPTIEQTPCLRVRIPDDRKDFMHAEMRFAQMTLYLAGANSASSLAQKPCRNVLRDEIDKYPNFVGRDADPISLSEERAKSFWDIRKIVDVSSPTIDNFGIWKQLQACEQIKRFALPCPHCGEYQALRWKQIKFELDKEKSDYIAHAKHTARYECEHCEKTIGDEYKASMLENGRYEANIALSYNPEMVGFHVSSLYSPWLTWGDIAERFLKAEQAIDDEGNYFPLQNFINGWLAEPWVPRVQEVRAEAELFRLKNDLPEGICPDETIALTMGVDMQKYGFWFSVWAWTSGMKSHLVDYGWRETWADILAIIFERPYECADGSRPFYVWRAGIDTGGGLDEEGASRTEEAYMMIRDVAAKSPNRVWGLRGLSATNTMRTERVRFTRVVRPPAGMKKDARFVGEITLAIVDTNLMKDVFFWRIDNDHVSLNSDTGRDFAMHLMSEEKRREKNGRHVWVRVRRENHLLDTSIYAHACADPEWLGGIPQFVAFQNEAIARQNKRKLQESPGRGNWLKGGNWFGGGRGNWLGNR